MMNFRSSHTHKEFRHFSGFFIRFTYFFVKLLIFHMKISIFPVKLSIFRRNFEFSNFSNPRRNFKFSKEIFNFPGDTQFFRRNFQSSNFSVAASNVQISVKNVYCKISKEILTFAPRTFFKPLKNHEFFNFPLDLM